MKLLRCVKGWKERRNVPLVATSRQFPIPLHLVTYLPIEPFFSRPWLLTPSPSSPSRRMIAAVALLTAAMAAQDGGGDATGGCPAAEVAAATTAGALTLDDLVGLGFLSRATVEHLAARAREARDGRPRRPASPPTSSPHVPPAPLQSIPSAPALPAVPQGAPPTATTKTALTTGAYSRPLFSFLAFKS